MSKGEAREKDLLVAVRGQIITTRPFTDILSLICDGSFGERGISITIGNCSRSCKIGRNDINNDYNNERNDTAVINREWPGNRMDSVIDDVIDAYVIKFHPAKSYL